MLPSFYQSCLQSQLSQTQFVTLEILVELQNRNLFIVSVVYQNRAIPLFWMWLDKQGQSSLSDQQKVLRPVFRLLKNHRFVLLGDREFHSIELAAWCVEKEVSFVFRLPKSTTVQPSYSSSFTRLDELPQAPGLTEHYVQIQVTQKRGFGKHNLAIRRNRTYRQSSANEVWYLLTNFVDVDQALFHDDARFCIEPLFRNLKSGGYHLEDGCACEHRFTALLVLIAIAYSIATVRGQRIRKKQAQRYVDYPFGELRSNRVKEPKRSRNRHRHFWIGLYGSLWIDSPTLWSTLADRLRALKPQKRRFFQRGLDAIALIQSAL